MQTFLPSTSYKQSAKWLDNQRLGKQRVECLQILRALTDPSYGWQHHPAVKMWRGYENSLVDYGKAICQEWIDRGYKDSCMNKIFYIWLDNDYYLQSGFIPDWLTEEFASNHRSILLGKTQESFEKQRVHFYELTWTWATKKEINRELKKLKRIKESFEWYQSFRWTETPAQRNEKGQWPYIWPTKIIDI